MHLPSRRGGIAPSLLAVLFCACALPVRAQAPPVPHPRLLFTAAGVPALQSRFAAAAGPAAAHLPNLATVVAVESPSPLPNLAAQGAWQVSRTLRRLNEVAFRFVMTGDPALLQNSKQVLLQLCGGLLVPTGTKPFVMASYPASLAWTYDMLHGHLSPSERAVVQNHLLQWVSAMQSGTGGYGPFSAYAGATDNWSFSWSAGLAMTLMALDGHPAVPNAALLIQQYMSMIEDGWLDAISPDGTVDEGVGYASYGIFWAIHAAVAARNGLYGEFLHHTNIMRTPRYLGAALLADTFLWTGDSSPSHKGNRIDPVIYHPLQLVQDAEALWALNRIFQTEPLSDATPSQGFSPYLSHFLYFPEGLEPVRPRVLSGFFRDNRNEGNSFENRTRNFHGIGLGGQALLHNSTDPQALRFGVHYNIKDEWVSHGHEDDGAIAIALGGKWQILDLGYASTNFSGAQSTDHNIVLTAGAAPFGGIQNNYYVPPDPNGRFLGERKASAFNPLWDYVRGCHRHMWQMDRADRMVVLIKDAAKPFAILVDRVKAGDASQTYQEVFHTASPAAGLGTAGSPWTIQAGGQTLRSVWLSPSQISIQSQGGGSQSGTVYTRQTVSASGVEVTFASYHGPEAPSGQTGLTSAAPGTHGGVLQFPEGPVKIMTSATGTAADGETAAEARLVVLRLQGGAVEGIYAAEAASVVHQGQVVLHASEPVMFSRRGGEARVETLSGAAQGLALSFFSPVPLDSLVVDGFPRPFQQTGSQVVSGPQSQVVLPFDDRVYAFTDRVLLDGVASPNFLVTASETGTSSAGVATLALKGNQFVGPGPLSLGLTVRPSPYAPGLSAGIGAVDASGGSLVDAAAEAAGPAAVRVAVRAGGHEIASALMARQGDGFCRFTLDLAPLAGAGRIAGASGETVLAFPLPVYGHPFRVRTWVDYGAEVDLVTLFDSAEDGQTPQGLVTYATHSGRGGVFIRCPGLIQLPVLASWVNGNQVPPEWMPLWFAIAGMSERLFVPGLGGNPPAPSLLEAGFESALPLVPAVAGSWHGFGLQAPSGVLLADLWGF